MGLQGISSSIRANHTECDLTTHILKWNMNSDNTVNSYYLDVSRLLLSTSVNYCKPNCFQGYRFLSFDDEDKSARASFLSH